MNIISIVFLSIFAALLFLFVFFYCKRIGPHKLLRQIFLPMSTASLFGAYLPIMNTLMPDSFHLMTHSSFAIFACLIALVCLTFEQNKVTTILFRISFFVNEIIWIYTFSSIFYIYKRPTALFVVAMIFYICIAVAFLILLGKQNIQKYAFVILNLTAASFFNYIALISLFAEPSINHILLFIGSLIKYAVILLTEYSKLKKRLRHSAFVSELLLIFGEMSLAASCILVQIF